MAPIAKPRVARSSSTAITAGFARSAAQPVGAWWDSADTGRTFAGRCNVDARGRDGLCMSGAYEAWLGGAAKWRLCALLRALQRQPSPPDKMIGVWADDLLLDSIAAGSDLAIAETARCLQLQARRRGAVGTAGAGTVARGGRRRSATSECPRVATGIGGRRACGSVTMALRRPFAALPTVRQPISHGAAAAGHVFRGQVQLFALFSSVRLPRINKLVPGRVGRGPPRPG
jgi:hypothetical protein